MGYKCQIPIGKPLLNPQQCQKQEKKWTIAKLSQVRKILHLFWKSRSQTGFFRWVYERFRLPVAPVYGGFPVKFRTFLGDPIPYDPNINAGELAEKVQQAIQSLIDKHQKIPGNILRALLERFHTKHNDHLQ
uniref:Transmembrane protein 68 n=1 Tax=Acanthochromis polyacanthus TaxID=80966 RepID=A0A3Q1G8A9_9TELE